MPRRAKRYSDPFLDEIHAVKKAVFAAAGYNVRTLVMQANKAGARRSKRHAGKKSAA